MANPDGRRYAQFLTLCCIALGVLVVLLSRENHLLEQRLGASEMVEDRHGTPAMSETFLRNLAMVGDEGPVQLEYTGNGERTLLLLFTSSCGACQDIMPLWDELVAAMSDSHVRVYGIRMDGSADDGWVPPIELSFEVYALDHEASPPISEIVVPATVLLDDLGGVQRAWYGLPQGQRFEGLEVLMADWQMASPAR